MRKIVALLTVAALLVAAATAYAATSVSWKVGSTKTVKIGRGGTVKWVWTDGQPHNVKGPGVSTKVVTKKGYSTSHRFTRKGTFRYVCQIHSSMKTTVKVG